MGAWRVLLTHFSNRYPRLADVRGGGAAATRAVPAFDLMEARAPAWAALRVLRIACGVPFTPSPPSHTPLS